MAIDTHEKRRNVPGVARPWMRKKLPGTIDQPWRIATGNGYGGNEIAEASLVVPDRQFALAAIGGSQASRVLGGDRERIYGTFRPGAKVTQK